MDRLMLSLDQRKVVMVDNFIDREDRGIIADIFDGMGFRKTESDSQETKHISQWVTSIPAPLTKQLARPIQAKIQEHFGIKKPKLLRAYCNSLSYGEMTFPHRDCDLGGSMITALLYGNRKWDRVWGGETLFYDEKGEVALASLPKPGRLILFHGSIEHKAGVPTRECHQARYSLALKFDGRTGG